MKKHKYLIVIDLCGKRKIFGFPTKKGRSDFIKAMEEIFGEEGFDYLISDTPLDKMMKHGITQHERNE